MSYFLSGKLSFGPLFSYTFPDRPSFLTSFGLARASCATCCPIPRRFRLFCGRLVCLAVPALVWVSVISSKRPWERYHPLQAYISRLIHSAGTLSRGFLSLFLPVGKNLTNWALGFLAVGKPCLSGRTSPHFGLGAIVLAPLALLSCIILLGYRLRRG